MVPVASVRVSRAPTYSGSHSRESRFRLQGLHLLWLTFQCHSTISFQSLIVVLLPQLFAGLGCSDFARHYSRNHSYFLLLQVLRCFNSLGCLTAAMYSPLVWYVVSISGFPIRTSAGQSLRPTRRSFSQVVASFFVFRCLGIHCTPFVTYSHLIIIVSY